MCIKGVCIPPSVLAILSEVGSMLGQRRRRWATIETKLGVCLKLTESADLFEPSKQGDVIQCWIDVGPAGRRRRWANREHKACFGWLSSTIPPVIQKSLLHLWGFSVYGWIQMLQAASFFCMCTHIGYIERWLHVHPYCELGVCKGKFVRSIYLLT